MKQQVSIIMPCFNAAEYVMTAIESVLSQDIHVQLIVVDDGSTDNTLEVLAGFVPEILLLQSDHKGVAHARNKAIEYVTGRYTLLLDADDALAPNALRKLLNAMDGEQDRVVYGNFSSWNRTMTKRLHLHRPARAGNTPMSHLVRRNLSPPGAILFPTQAFEKTGRFGQEVSGCEDWDFVIRLARAGYRFRHLNREIFYYRRLPFSASNQTGRMLASGTEVIRRCHYGDNRVHGDLYRDGYRQENLKKNLFNYHAVCLALSMFANGMGDGEDIIRTMVIPEAPNWREFGEAFRKSVWWNSLAVEGDQARLIYDAQLKCVGLIMGVAEIRRWSQDMISSILFPDFSELLWRPGPKKAYRLLKEWKLARKIYSQVEI